MPNPRDVFDDHEKYWAFLTSSSDDEFEDQHFERKESGRVGNDGQVNPSQFGKAKEEIIQSISAFANANPSGGLLAIGISISGEVKGIRHLREDQINSLTAFQDLLRNQAAIHKFVDCTNAEGDSDQVLLVYVPYAGNGICETLTTPSKAWFRFGKQNRPLTDELREQLKRDKKIVDFERAYCCEFDISDVDRDILREFRRVFLTRTSRNQTGFDLASD